MTKQQRSYIAAKQCLNAKRKLEKKRRVASDAIALVLRETFPNSLTSRPPDPTRKGTFFRALPGSLETGRRR